MLTNRFVLVVALTTSILLVQSLSGAEDPAPEDNVDTVTIGAIYPLTGPLATTGADMQNGVLFAAEVINNQYDLDLPLARSEGLDSLGARVEIIFGDSQGSPSQGRSEAKRLIDEGSAALVGCYQSAVTSAAGQVAEDEKVPFLTATSTAPTLTRRGFDWFFRTTPDDDIFVRNFFQFLDDVRGTEGADTTRLAVVHEDSVWGTGVVEYAKQRAEEYGYEVVETISYSSNATNLSSKVRRLQDARPDVVIQASYINDAVLYMRAYKDANFSVPILADDAGFIEPEFLNVLGEDGEYVLTRATWSGDLAESKPLAGAVNRIFKQRYGTEMNGNSARAFTATLVLADAINRAGSTDSEAVQSALQETNMSGEVLIMPWEGVRFDDTGQNVLGRGVICQVIGQEYRTVWPRDLATEDVIWPVPAWNER